MHGRLTHLYDCGCDQCKHKPEQLDLALNPKFKRLLKTIEKAFKKLHKNKGYKPEDLDQVPEYREVIKETNGFLSRGLTDNELSDAMRQSLEEDIFLFSGLKTHAQLLEAAQYIKEDGTIKSRQQFLNDAKGVKDKHQTYLEAEYDFVKGSALMAERWEKFSDNDRYYLQYRTASDDRVRDSHAVLHDTTLPKDDPFWDRYFPPNGWRCRCTTVEVLKATNKESDSKKAAKAGAKATTQIGKGGKNKLELFRFNAGKLRKAMPPKHSYTKVQGSKKAKTKTRNVYEEERKLKRKTKDKEVHEWTKKNIPEGGKTVKTKNFKTGEATILRKNVRGIAAHFTNPSLKEMASDILNWIDKPTYKSSASLNDSKVKKSVKNLANKKARGVTDYNYYEFDWMEKKYRLNVEVIDGKEFPYSVNEITNAK